MTGTRLASLTWPEAKEAIQANPVVILPVGSTEAPATPPATCCSTCSMARTGLAAGPAGPAGRMAALAGIDAHQVRQWLFARSVQEPVGSPLMCQVAARLAPASPAATAGTPGWLVTCRAPGSGQFMFRTGRSEFAM